MPENELYDLLNYISILFILILFLSICLFYSSSIVYYIKQNYNNKITPLWIDYVITIFSGILFSFIYLLTLLFNKTKRIYYLEELYSNELFISSNSFIFLFFYSVINNSIFDIIKCVQLSYKIIKFQKISNNDNDTLIEKLKEINVMGIIKPKLHQYYLMAFNSVNIISIIIFIIIYTDINIQNDFLSVNNYKVYLIRNYHLASLLILIFCFLIMNVLRKKLLDKKYYINDIFKMKIYNIVFNQIVYYLDIFFFKLIIDLFVNIPLIIYFSFSVFNTLAIIFFELTLFIYIFIGGNILLSIDHNNKYINKIKKSKHLKILFCFKDIHLHLNNAINFFLSNYEYFLECSDEEKKILSELNINFIDKNKNNKKEPIIQIKEEDIENKSYSKCDSKSCKSSSKSDCKSDNKSDSKSDEDNENFDTISEYYALYKLLYAYFDKNKDFYMNLLKKVKKNGFVLFNIDSQSVDKIILFSEQENKNLIKSIKLNKNDIFKNEKELLDNLNKKYKKSKKAKIQFTIESLSQIPLFDIFPFYQMKIEDILKALHPTSNMKLFKRFIENLNKTNSMKGSLKNVNSFNKESEKNVNSFNKESEKNINFDNNIEKISNNGNKINENQIIENINVNDESKRKSNTYNSESYSENKSSESNETNCYQTYNNLLMLEIYNKSDFVDNKQILELNESFKSYIIEQIKKAKPTFLPLLLGIYNIKFLGKNKIIVLYRNPLYFGSSYGFNNWINFYITENIERNKKSNDIKNEVIDLDGLNEIEIKGNLKLNPEQYEDIKITLQNDISFLANLSYKLFPILHLFLGMDKAKEDQFKKSHFMNESYIIGSLDSQKQHSLSFLLNSSSENSANLSMDKKDMISIDSNSYNSLLEKDYICLNDKKYINIKIYLSNFFRYGNKCSNEDEGNTLFTCDFYRTFIQNQLFSYLTKGNLFPNEDMDNEKKKKLRSSLKSNEEERIIIKTTDS